MTASAGAQPLLAPAGVPSPPSTTGTPITPGTTGTPRPAGASAMAAAVTAQRAATQGSALLGLLRRAAGADPLVGDALEHYVDAVGQREVGRRLSVLRHRSGPTPPWHLLHDLPLGALEGDVDERADHVLVGPGGAYAVTTLHLPGSRVRAARTGLVVDGERAEHLRRAQQRARAVQQLLARACGVDVPVRAVVVVLGAERLALPLRTGDVAVLRAPVLVRWLRRQPRVLDTATAAHLAAAARDLQAGADQPVGQVADAFEDLHERVRAADRLRRAWFVALAVAGSTGVTTLLAAVSL